MDEEGRYGSLFGSRAFCGLLDAAKLSEMAAVDGDRLVDAMARAGFDASQAPKPGRRMGPWPPTSSCTSSKGPGSRRPGIPIGVVESIVGVRRTRLIFIGQADHAGTTPMERRRDGFLAGAEYAIKARDLVVKRGGAHGASPTSAWSPCTPA